MKKTRPTVVYFLRHGEPANPKRLMKGTADFVLSKKGIAQIGRQAVNLLSERVGALFTSPVKRCVQTAEIVARVLNEDRVELDTAGRPVGSGGVRVRRVNELTEWTSSLDGQPQRIAQEMGEEAYNQTFEPREKVTGRMKKFLDRVLVAYSGQVIIAVSHQGPIDLLLLSLEGKDASRAPFVGLRTEKGEMVRTEFDCKGKLIKLERFPPGT